MVRLLTLLTSVVLFATLVYGGDFSRRRFTYCNALNSNHQLTVDFIKAIKPSSQNFVICPVCIQVMGTITQEGAKGKTASEIAKVLYQTEDKKALLPLYRELLVNLNRNSRNVEFGTRMFVNKTVNIQDDYYVKLIQFFRSDVVRIDFSDVREATDTINYWVKKITRDHIPELFRRGTLKANEKLVIVNTVFFRDSWIFPFDLIENEQFYESPDRSVEIRMIGMKEVEVKSGFSNNLKANIIELPFKQPGMRMVVVLPKAINGLEGVESRLDTFDVFRELSKMKEKVMNVYIPDLRRRNSMDLTGILKKLGMVTAFGENADFSDISPDKLYISQLVQKVYVKVDAEGATAATARAVDDYSADYSAADYYDGYRDTGLFRADHPYLYFILHEDTIMFAGRVAHF